MTFPDSGSPSLDDFLNAFASGPSYSEDLKDAFSQVIVYAWRNPEFMKELREDPRNAIETLINEGKPEALATSAATIRDRIFGSDSVEGLFGLPPLPEQFKSLNDEQLTTLVKQPKVFGIMRFT